MDENLGDLKLKLTSLCNRIGIPANDQPQPVYLLTQLIPESDAMGGRMPLNVVVVLDHSSPAMTEGLPVFKQALKDLVEQLQPTDNFSLVSLAGPAVISATPVIEKTRLKRQIDKLAITTEALAADGLAEGLRQTLANRADGSINRLLIILAGEIEAKAGELESLADQAGADGIPFSVIGFGNRWDDALWAEMADRSSLATPGSLNGMLEYAPSIDEVAEVMQRVYRSMHVLGRDVQITLRFIRGVDVRQAWRVAPNIQCLDLPSSQEQVVTLHSAELSQEGIAYLVEANLPPRAAGQVRLAQTEVVQRSITNLEIRHNVDLVVEFLQDMGGTNPLDCYVMNFVEMAQARRLNLAAMAEMNAGNRQAAIQKFRQAAAILVSQGHTVLADCIRGEADYNIRQYGQISSEGRKLILFTGRSVANPEAD
jgi:hypothetical protein